MQNVDHDGIVGITHRYCGISGVEEEERGHCLHLPDIRQGYPDVTMTEENDSDPGS